MGRQSTELTTKDDAVARIMGDVMPGAEDEREVQRALVTRILQAQDLEGMFQDLSTTATRDMIGVPIAIRDCRLMESQLEGSSGVYMLLDAVHLDTGEPIVMNTGSSQIMATVWGAKQHNVLPLEVEVAEAKAAKQGRSAPLKLIPIRQTLAAIDAAKAERAAATT